MIAATTSAARKSLHNACQMNRGTRLRLGAARPLPRPLCLFHSSFVSHLGPSTYAGRLLVRRQARRSALVAKSPVEKMLLHATALQSGSRDVALARAPGATAFESSDRVVRGDFLRAVLLMRAGNAPVARGAITLREVIIRGQLDLSKQSIDQPISLLDCRSPTAWS